MLPVFLVIGAGYAATRSGVFSSSAVDGLMVFTQSFAIPCLLFRGLVDLDLGAVFDPRLLLSFYAGAVVCFALGILGARRLFGRRPGEAVAIGFGALFSNSVLLGLPIMERAYGAGVAGAELRDHLDPRALLLPRRHHRDGVRPRRRPRPRRHRARGGAGDVPQRADDRARCSASSSTSAASRCPARCAAPST